MKAKFDFREAIKIYKVILISRKFMNLVEIVVLKSFEMFYKYLGIF